MIAVSLAKELLGVKYLSSFYVNSSELNIFRIVNSNGESFFRIQDYVEFKQLEQCIIARTDLFIEYLKHIEKITYSEIAKKTKCSITSIRTGKFGILLSEKIINTYKDTQYYKNFNTYYGFYGNDKLDALLKRYKELKCKK